MSSKPYFAYIRVSTARQGQLGTSLVEQRSAIQRHAQKKSLHIIREFQEQETAAQRGRPVFRQMMQALQEGKASGLVMHKIDRGARNLKDWAELGELIDSGIEVHFANENLDLYSRGGRLSADIQAVVAADYIRNLREEVKKGFYGRIKQGYYPMPAPIGYLDNGGGKAKAIDPHYGPLVREAFELYATGRYSLKALQAKMNSLTLSSRSGEPLSINSLANILHNIFYIGLIRIKKSQEYFPGLHEPLISKKLFDRVQTVLASRLSKSGPSGRLSEIFLFRRLLVCKSCRHLLIGERQKGHNYYRCHTKTCPQKSIREEKVRTSIRSTLRKLEPNPDKDRQFHCWLTDRRRSMGKRISERRNELLQKLDRTRLFLGRLTDAFITEAVSKDLFLERKNHLVATEIELKEELANLEIAELQTIKQYERAFQFAQTASLTFVYASYERKREVIKEIFEKLEVSNRRTAIKLRDPFVLLRGQVKN